MNNDFFKFPFNLQSQGVEHIRRVVEYGRNPVGPGSVPFALLDLCIFMFG